VAAATFMAFFGEHEFFPAPHPQQDLAKQR
jgi:hypothetical protein